MKGHPPYDVRGKEQPLSVLTYSEHYPGRALESRLRSVSPEPKAGLLHYTGFPFV